jgi:hypothetical protein
MIFYSGYLFKYINIVPIIQFEIMTPMKLCLHQKTTKSENNVTIVCLV